MARWRFQSNDAGEAEGLGNAGIETFKGSPFPGIARESSQNSIDAARTSKDGSSSTVHVRFRLIHVGRDEIPGCDQLSLHLDSCLQQAVAGGLQKEVAFFTNARDVLGREVIPILCVEDYGTVGLAGPAVAGTPFHALVKSSGVSQKADSSAVGSFGIGKNAAFAISRVRTVFYSTMYEVGGISISMIQGKCILTSHEHDGSRLRATGYWGADGFMPLPNDAEGVPAWLVRNEVGTTVASIGFPDESEDGSEWQWLMVESLVRNFFAAIHRGEVKFSVAWPDAHEVSIDSATIKDLMQRAEIVRAAEVGGTTEELTLSRELYQAVRDCESTALIKLDEGKLEFRMGILQEDGLSRRVGFLRKGMFIADNLKHFNHPLARFPMSRDFVAFVEPTNGAAASMLRELEGPRHDDFSAERIDSVALKKYYKKHMKALGNEIRERIKSETTSVSSSEIQLEEMNEFFGGMESGETIPSSGRKDLDPSTQVLRRLKTRKIEERGRGPSGDSGGSGGRRRNATDGGLPGGPRDGRGRGSAAGRGGNAVAYEQLRNQVAEGGRRRLLSFLPTESGVAYLELEAAGVASEEKLRIRAPGGDWRAAAEVKLTEGVPFEIEVETEVEYRGPIRVVLARDEAGSQ